MKLESADSTFLRHCTQCHQPDHSLQLYKFLPQMRPAIPPDQFFCFNIIYSQIIKCTRHFFQIGYTIYMLVIKASLIWP